MDYEKSAWGKLTDMVKRTDVMSEVSKKFKDTILKLTHTSGKITYCWYYGNNGVDNHTIRDLELGKELVIPHDDITEVLVPVVQIGCYTSPTLRSAVVFSTLPHRQWKKGLCKYNSFVKGITHKIGMPVDNLFNTAINDIILNPLNEPMDLEQSLTKLIEKDLESIAINRDFILSYNYIDEDKGYYLLFYHQYLIGFIYPKKKIINVEHEFFLQEVLDTKHQWCPEYGVM